MDLLNNFLWLYANEHIDMNLLLFAVEHIANIVKAIEQTESKDVQQLKFPDNEQGRKLSSIYKEHLNVELELIKEEND